METQLIGAFSHCVVTNPDPHIPSKFAIQTHLNHWIANVGPPQCLVSDRIKRFPSKIHNHLIHLLLSILFFLKFNIKTSLVLTFLKIF